jgi:hypothetical protein
MLPQTFEKTGQVSLRLLLEDLRLKIDHPLIVRVADATVATLVEAALF